MKVIIDSISLNKALKAIQPSISVNKILPLLENVKCQVKDNIIKLMGTNTSLTIITTLTCNSDSDGSFLLPFKQVLNITSVISEPIEISVGKNITLKSSKDKFSLGISEDVAVFPKMPVFESDLSIDIDGTFISHMISATKFTLSDKNEYNAFNHVCIDALQDSIQIAASNKMKMIIFKEKAKNKNVKKYLPDSSFISALAGIEESVLSLSDKFIKVSTDDITVIGTLSDQTFADYKSAIKPHDVNLELNRDEVLDAITKMSTIAVVNPFFFLSFTKSGVNINFKDLEFDREFDTDIKCKHDLEFDKLCLNAADLKSIILAMPKEDTIKLSVTGSRSLMYVDCEDKSVEGFVMPYLINN